VSSIESTNQYWCESKKKQIDKPPYRGVDAVSDDRESNGLIQQHQQFFRIQTLKKEEGEGRREKGEGRREKGEGRRFGLFR